MRKGNLNCRTKFMFVVARVPFYGRMCPRNPTTAGRANSSILGENFRQRVRELATQCGNVAFGTHVLPPTHLAGKGPAIWPMANSARGSNDTCSRVPPRALGQCAAYRQLRSRRWSSNRFGTISNRRSPLMTAISSTLTSPASRSNRTSGHPSCRGTANESKSREAEHS
jgi:hypothetical protein